MRAVATTIPSSLVVASGKTSRSRSSCGLRTQVCNVLWVAVSGWGVLVKRLDSEDDKEEEGEKERLGQGPVAEEAESVASSLAI